MPRFLQSFTRSSVRPQRGLRHAVTALPGTITSLALCVSVACASLSTTQTPPKVSNWPEIRPDFPEEALRARMQEYSASFAAEVDLTASAIERRTDDLVVRRNALLWKLRAIPEMRKACFRLGPASALVDAWTLARQMDQLFTAGGGVDAFGAYQPEAVEVSRRLVDQMREIASTITVSPEGRDQLERTIVDPWLAAHPLRDMTFVRESPIARFAEQARARGDVFQSVGTMDEMMRSLSHEARIYMADLPRQVRGEIDLLRVDVLPQESLASMQGDLHASAAAADRISATVEGMPSLVREERQIVLDDVSRQRALLMEAVSVERELAISATFRAFAEERKQLLHDLEVQRLATLEWATAERRDTIAIMLREMAGAGGALRGERAALVADVRQIVDLVLLRLALFVVVAVALAPIVAHVYARVWPRK